MTCMHMFTYICRYTFAYTNKYINNGQNRLVCRYLSMCFCVWFYIDIHKYIDKNVNVIQT